MQRRRSTPRKHYDSSGSPLITDSIGSGHASAANRAANTTSSRRTSAGIELRELPSHASSSSISRPFHRVADVPDNAYFPPSYHAQRVPFEDTPLIMKPLVSAVQAWSCFVISVFAIVILSTLGLLFRGNHHEMVGGMKDPENGPEVAATIFVAVLVYAGFLVFCGLQGMMHLRENRRGAIAL
ncbi:hypothetical protein CMQ_3784 [Grosmannia clavigera kw1407]|uniref:Uncharacterized protein n=1 Tax=Grosmannia clavigera (strain kw1407 / UAMH 11150) TaxID=655863 RepID=F0X939_GROCL|nr:uncharacterized protein CMQ_3784 [Grosmannia clavigera kw1407]EFX05715.1 hypothetical protein CMQ_3784 [Grosmannia clavigera kw1407]